MWRRQFEPGLRNTVDGLLGQSLLVCDDVVRIVMAGRARRTLYGLNDVTAIPDSCYLRFCLGVDKEGRCFLSEDDATILEERMDLTLRCFPIQFILFPTNESTSHIPPHTYTLSKHAISYSPGFGVL